MCRDVVHPTPSTLVNSLHNQPTSAPLLSPMLLAKLLQYFWKTGPRPREPRRAAVLHPRLRPQPDLGQVSGALEVPQGSPFTSSCPSLYLP